MGHPCKYIIFLRAHKTFVRFSVGPIFFTTFSVYFLCTSHATNIKRLLLLAKCCCMEKQYQQYKLTFIKTFIKTTTQWQEQTKFTLSSTLFYNGKWA